MSKYEEIIKSSNYPELKSCCDEQGLVLGQESDNDSYKFSIMSKDPENSNVCSGTITADKVVIFISDKDNNIIETYDQRYDSEDSRLDLLKTSLEVFRAMSDIDIEPPSEDDDEEILTEDGESSELEDGPDLIFKLDNLIKITENLSDKLIECAEMTDEIELRANLLSLSNSALSLGMEIKENIDLYDELVVEDEEIEDTDEELESRNRIKYEAIKGIISLKKLFKNSDSEKSTLEHLDRILKKLS